MTDQLEVRTDDEPTDDDVKLGYIVRLAVVPAFLLVVPVLVVVSGIQDDRPWRASISAYYYSGARGLFIYAAIALALLLRIYFKDIEKSKKSSARRPIEYGAATLSSLAAVILAIFPTAPEGGDRFTMNSVVHGIASAVLFLSLILIVLYVFMHKQSPELEVTTGNRVVYAVCGLVMLGLSATCVTLIVRQAMDGWLFWLEVAALAAFFVAWTVKNWSQYQAWLVASKKAVAVLKRGVVEAAVKIRIEQRSL